LPIRGNPENMAGTAVQFPSPKNARVRETSCSASRLVGHLQHRDNRGTISVSAAQPLQHFPGLGCFFSRLRLQVVPGIILRRSAPRTNQHRPGIIRRAVPREFFLQAKRMFGKSNSRSASLANKLAHDFSGVSVFDRRNKSSPGLGRDQKNRDWRKGFHSQSSGNRLPLSALALLAGGSAGFRGSNSSASLLRTFPTRSLTGQATILSSG